MVIQPFTNEKRLLKTNKIYLGGKGSSLNKDALDNDTEELWTFFEFSCIQSIGYKSRS